MKENQLFRQGVRGFSISLFCILLAICAVSISAKYQRPGHPFCGGMLGAGFPALFICDAWGGGSPTGSWDKIDFADVINGGITPGGFLVDFLFYLTLIGMTWFIASSLIHKRVPQSDLWWTMFIAIGFITGFLCAILIFLPNYLLYVKPPFMFMRTPTPALSIPTPIGTISTFSPTSTPMATSAP